MFGSDLPSRQSNMPRCVCFSCQDVESHLLWKTYWNLIEKVQPRQLKLTKYVTFSEVQRCGLTSNCFVSNLVWMMRSSSIPWKSFLNLRRNHMRNSQSLMRIGWKVVKAKNVGENLLLRKSLFFFFWGPLLRLLIYFRHSIWLCSYEKKIKDYNFGSLIRTDARGEYGETNTIFGMTFFIFVVMSSPIPPPCFSLRSLYWFILVTRTQVCYQSKRQNWATKLYVIGIPCESLRHLKFLAVEVRHYNSDLLKLSDHSS